MSHAIAAAVSRRLSFVRGAPSLARDHRDEDHFAEARRRREKVGPHRCAGAGRRPPRLDRGDAAARQAQARLHAGYPGGITERSAKSILEGRFTERVVEKAVERMLPRGPLFRKILGNLRVYKGTEHPHTAQQPEALDVGALNRKNVSL